MDYIFCVYCGARNDINAVFCLNCGEKLYRSDESNDFSIEEQTENTFNSNFEDTKESSINNRNHNIQSQDVNSSDIDEMYSGSETLSASTMQKQKNILNVEKKKRTVKKSPYLTLLIILSAVVLSIACAVVVFRSTSISLIPNSYEDYSSDSQEDSAPKKSFPQEQSEDNSRIIINNITQGNFNDIAGNYCRHNGACISISKSADVLLVESDGSLIDDAARFGDYPFSSYLQGIKVSTAKLHDNIELKQTAYLSMIADSSSCASGTLDAVLPSCTAPDGSYMYLNITFFYVSKGTTVDQVKSETQAIIDGNNPDSSKPYLVFQKEAGTNAPFDASDDEVFYLVQ